MIIGKYPIRLFEYNMVDLMYNSDVSINQGYGYSDTNSRYFNATRPVKTVIGRTEQTDDYGNVYDKNGDQKYVKLYDYISMDSVYTIRYEINSFYVSGNFEFTIETNNNRKGGNSKYTLMIKPSRIPSSYEDLLYNIDVEVFCSCNDFRFTFMNHAYTSLYNFSFGKFGIFPIGDRISMKKDVEYEYGTYYSNNDEVISQNMSSYDNQSLPRYKHYWDSGKEDAPTRNPSRKGAVCKHLIFLFDMMRKQTLPFVEDVKNDIELENSNRVKPIQFNIDKTFRQGYKVISDNPKMVKKIRTEKISNIKRITLMDIKSNNVIIFNINASNNIDLLKKAVLTDLSNFDSDYIKKAKIENKIPDFYLGKNWEKSYLELETFFDNLKEKYENEQRYLKSQIKVNDYNSSVNDIIQNSSMFDDLFNNDEDKYQELLNKHKYDDFNKFIKNFNEFNKNE